MSICKSKNGYWITSKNDKSHFTIKEFACKCGCGMDETDQELIDILEIFRECIKMPIKIESGCRCDIYNKIIHGSKKSAHLPVCKGADIQIKGLYREEIFIMASTMQFKGVGIYPHNSIHIDVMTRKSNPTYWYQDKKGRYFYFTNANVCLEEFKKMIKGK